MSFERSIPVAAVIVNGRARRDLQDIDQLAASIAALGLLHPVVLNGRHELIAGGRRLAAVKRLGWSHVPCRIVEGLDDAVAALRAERDENDCRQPLRPREAVDLGRRLEALERAAARDRQRVAGPRSGRGAKSTASANLAEAVKGDTRDKVAAAVGMSRTTYAKAKAVADAAAADPALESVAAEMDRSGNVDAAYRTVTVNGKPFVPSAKTDVVLRWLDLLLHTSKLTRGVERCGGMAKLTRDWPAAQKTEAVRRLTTIIDTLLEWRQTLGNRKDSRRDHRPAHARRRVDR